MKKLAAILVVVLGIGLVGCSYVRPHSHQVTRDQAITHNVAMAISHTTMTPAPTVRINTLHRIVYLSGPVYSRHQAHVLTHVAWNVPHVKHVVDNMTIKS